MKKIIFDYDGNGARRKNKLIPRLLLCLGLAVVAAVCAVGISKAINSITIKNSRSPKRLYALWNDADYRGVYDLSQQILTEQPFQNIAASFLGYSAYYLALSQTDTVLSQTYIDESISALRIAIIGAKQNTRAQINYLLGKAYFLKNTLNSYNYYADLAISFLSQAKKTGYRADDISEYLGLSYASIGMTEQSIAAFTDALLVRESDVLLLSIGEQYLKSGDRSAAKQYFFRVSATSPDDSLVHKSKNLLGLLYIEEENLVEAEKEFRAILEKDVNSADAYYGLGVLYEKQGDMARARAQWRNALKAQANHAGAKYKLGA